MVNIYCVYNADIISSLIIILSSASFFNVEELLSLLNGLVYEKGQGLLTLSQLLLKRNFRLIQIYDDTFHDIVLGKIDLDEVG